VVAASEYGWQCGVVVSRIRRMNEVTLHRAWLVLVWVTVFVQVVPSQYVTSQPCIRHFTK